MFFSFWWKGIVGRDIFDGVARPEWVANTLWLAWNGPCMRRQLRQTGAKQLGPEVLSVVKRAKDILCTLISPLFLILQALCI